MLPVFIISSRQKSIEPLISGSLSRLGSVMRCTQREICCAQWPDYIVLSCRSAECINSERGIVVLCDPQVKRLKLSPGLVPILLSSDKRARRLLRENENAVVCCGCSAKDSVTMSSRSGGRVLIGLQRELFDLHGNPIEPAEYSFNDPGGDIQLLMLCAAVLIEVGCPETGELCVMS